MNYLKYRNSAINYLILIQKINTEIEKSVNQLPQIQKFRNHSINYLVLIQKINTEIRKLRNQSINYITLIQKINSEIQKFRNSEILKFRNQKSTTSQSVSESSRALLLPPTSACFKSFFYEIQTTSINNHLIILF